MTELVLRDCGWRANSLGNMLPFETLRRALERDRPRLMWLSVTSIRDADRFIASFNTLCETATSHGSAIVVGGQALTADIRRLLRYTTYCDNFQHLEAFGKSLNPGTECLNMANSGLSQYDAILFLSFGGPEKRDDVIPFGERAAW